LRGIRTEGVLGTERPDIVRVGVRKTPHIAHKGGSGEVSHVQKFNKQAGWPRENGAAASLGGSGLK
jgi:hypothetical protein